MWYPEFNLKENPFAFKDRATEKEYYIDFDLIPTKAGDEVVLMATSKMSVIFVGAKGCGKSTSLELAFLALYDKNKKAFTAIGPRTFPALYEQLRESLIDVLGEKVYDEALELIAYGYRDELKDWCYEHIQKPTGTITPCDYPFCQKHKRCILWKGGTTPKLKEITQAFPETPCSLKEWMTLKMFESIASTEKGVFPHIFLLDVPDDIVEVGARYFSRFLVELRKVTRGIVILMATRQQYEKLIKTEAFARYTRLDFPLLSKDELKCIYEKRLKKVTEGEFKTAFDEDSLNYIAESSIHNPREFLRRCGIVLSKMIGQKRKSPSTLDFVLSVLGGEANISEKDAFEATIKDFLKVGIGWIKVKVLREHLKDKYNTEISSARLGRMCKKKGFDQRYNPDSEYKLR